MIDTIADSLAGNDLGIDNTNALGAEWMRREAVKAASPWQFDTEEGNNSRKAAVRNILTIPSPTPADLLAAAIRLPEVRALVEARRKHVDAVDAYNRQRNWCERERNMGNWHGKNCDDEYRAMHVAQSAFIGAAQDFTDAALAALPKGATK